MRFSRSIAQVRRLILWLILRNGDRISPLVGKAGTQLQGSLLSLSRAVGQRRYRILLRLNAGEPQAKRMDSGTLLNVCVVLLRDLSSRRAEDRGVDDSRFVRDEANSSCEDSQSVLHAAAEID